MKRISHVAKSTGRAGTKHRTGLHRVAIAVLAAALTAGAGTFSPSWGLTLTGGPVYAGQGGTPVSGATCTPSGTATNSGGAQVSCSGHSLTGVTALYYGMKVDNITVGERMDNSAGPAASTTNRWVYVSSTSSSITYSAVTRVWDQTASGGAGAWNNVNARLVLTLVSGSGTVVATGGNPANSAANGDIEALFRITSTATFAVDVDIYAAVQPAIPNTSQWANPTVFEPYHTTNATHQSYMRADLGFYYSLCGDSVTDTGGGEACDGGACCQSNCQYSPTATVCRASGGECDLQENCTGSSATCPGDSKKSNGTACTADSNPCSLDQCNGSSNFCLHPAGNAGATCRAAAGVCDLVETCTGASTTCPSDSKSSAVCRASAGTCDVAESCSGGNDCPADGFLGTTTTCRAAAGVCDISEVCPGNSASCPADAKSSAVCRAASGECDLAESCDGSGNNCPIDAVKTILTACTADSNACTDDYCDGSSKLCTHPNDDSNSCDDGVACNNPGDNCTNGVCEGGTDSCPECQQCNGMAGCEPRPNTVPCTSDGNVCTDDFCDGAGSCVSTANSAPCTDSQFCNGNDTCSGGTCSLHTGDPCTGGSECADSCNEAADNCFDSAATPCTDDGNVCTNDLCNGSGGCGHPNNSASCSDGVFCNGTDTCSGGSCSLHAGNPCLAGGECNNSCNEGAGNCFVTAGTACTSDSNVCTIDECNGAGSCAHNPGNSGTTCRSTGGACDVAETCDGVSTSCPTDVFVTAGTSCRASSGGCDPAETCTGSSATCPVDAISPSNTVCRSAAGSCDVAEVCDGSSTACPADVVAPSTTECRSSMGECDVAENCDGSTATCPTDGKQMTGTACTPDLIDCTYDECDGATNICQHALKPMGTTCGNPTDTPCDNPDTCDGAGGCLANYEPLSTPCGDSDSCSSGIKTVADECDGAGACTDNGSITCAPFACDMAGINCLTECNADPDCEANSLCFIDTGNTAGQCVATAVCAPTPLSGCKETNEPRASSLQIKEPPSSALKTKLRWKWKKGDALLAEFGQPFTSHTSYAFCVYDGSNNLIYVGTVPFGGTCTGFDCWKPTSSGFFYKDKAAVQEGIGKLKMKRNDTPSRSSIQIAAHNGLMTLMTPPQGLLLSPPYTLPVTAQFVATTGACWQATYTSDPLSVKKNEAGRFKGKNVLP